MIFDQILKSSFLLYTNIVKTILNFKIIIINQFFIKKVYKKIFINNPSQTQQRIKIIILDPINLVTHIQLLMGQPSNNSPPTHLLRMLHTNHNPLELK